MYKLSPSSIHNTFVCSCLLVKAEELLFKAESNDKKEKLGIRFRLTKGTSADMLVDIWSPL